MYGVLLKLEFLVSERTVSRSPGRGILGPEQRQTGSGISSWFQWHVPSPVRVVRRRSRPPPGCQRVARGALHANYSSPGPAPGRINTAPTSRLRAVGTAAIAGWFTSAADCGLQGERTRVTGFHRGDLVTFASQAGRSSPRGPGCSGETGLRRSGTWPRASGRPPRRRARRPSSASGASSRPSRQARTPSPGLSRDDGTGLLRSVELRHYSLARYWRGTRHHIRARASSTGSGTSAFLYVMASAKTVLFELYGGSVNRR